MRFDQRMVSTFDGERLFVSFSELGHKNWIIITHGIGEHSGRHHHVAAHLSQYANICLYDLRGHGKSSGERAYINDFFSFAKDLMCIIKFLKDEFKMAHFMLYGHSMGALITCDFMQNHKLIDPNFFSEGNCSYPSMVVVSAPPVEPAGWVGSLVRNIPQYWLNVLAGLNKSAKISGLIDLFYLSHDVRVFEDYLKDPLNSTKLHTKLLFQLVRRARIVFSRPLGVECKMHVIVGTKDRLVSHKSAMSYFHRMEPKAEIHVVDEGYHELHNEVERIRVKFYNVLNSTIIQAIKNS